MRIPTLCGVIDRRLLVNFRCHPDVLARQLPAPFRPQLHRGHALVGICLIRLRAVRPRGLPAWLGIRSENAAHRAAVHWDQGGRCHTGVFVRRRDTGSWLNAMAGGRLFPGEHHRARFDVADDGTRLAIAMRSDDGTADLDVTGAVAREWPAGSVFGSCDEASAFFAAGAVGWSVTGQPGRFDGLELRCKRWHVEPLAVSGLTSRWFDDRERFPPGSIAFDNALLMRNIDHSWHGRPDLCCGP
jgi:hypothetical protein